MMKIMINALRRHIVHPVHKVNSKMLVFFLGGGGFVFKFLFHFVSSIDHTHNGQKKKDKKTNNDPQNITQKTKD